MFEQGKVLKKEGDRLFIQITRPSDCSKCGLCPTRGEKILEITNNPDIEPGDLVEVEIPERELIKMSLTLYLLPAFIFVAGFLAGALFLPDGWGIVTGLGLLLPAGLYLRRHGRHKKPDINVRKT